MTTRELKPTRPQPACPECEKLLVVSEKSNIIGEFLDTFLSHKGLHLARYIDVVKGSFIDEDGDWQYFDDMLVPAREYSNESGINHLLAEYFGINLDKVEQERRELLEWIREQNG